jgi:4'-phosphopantetheinyl transferase
VATTARAERRSRRQRHGTLHLAELWLVDLASSAPALEALERRTPRLAADDRARARRLVDPAARRHRQAAYIALRILLERAAGPRVRGARFQRSPGGKPRLAIGNATFSLSHAGGLALIGIARGRPIGVDLERARAVRMASRRREEILAVGSGLADEPAGEAASTAAVLQAWCRIEAFAKAQGRGLDAVLRDLGLRKRSGRELAPASIAAAAARLARLARLGVSSVKLPPNLYAAIALRRGVRPPALRRFPTGVRTILRLLAGDPHQVRSMMVKPRRRSIR